MNAWQERLIAEADELETKVDALGRFMDTDEYERLTGTEKLPLWSQKQFMLGYLAVLKVRIEALGDMSDD